MKKKIALLLACVMAFGIAVGGTLAWLTDKTDAVVNTFTESDVDITLAETTGPSYKMVPGDTIAKDPKATVLADSEACWLFVKVVESTDKKFDDYMTYEMAAGWTELTEGSGIYYREVSDTAADQVFNVLADNQVKVKTTVTKAMMDELTTANYPTLTFTAYAIQRASFETAEAAWEGITTPAT